MTNALAYFAEVPLKTKKSLMTLAQNHKRLYTVINEKVWLSLKKVGAKETCNLIEKHFADRYLVDQIVFDQKTGNQKESREY